MELKLFPSQRRLKWAEQNIRPSLALAASGLRYLIVFIVHIDFAGYQFHEQSRLVRPLLPYDKLTNRNSDEVSELSAGGSNVQSGDSHHDVFSAIGYDDSGLQHSPRFLRLQSPRFPAACSPVQSRPCRSLWLNTSLVPIRNSSPPILTHPRMRLLTLTMSLTQSILSKSRQRDKIL